MSPQIFRIGLNRPPLNFCDSAKVTASSGNFIAIGNFDGVHLGHRSLFEKLVSLRADRKGKNIALSFYPHPSVKLGRLDRVANITSLHQKRRALAELQVDILCLVHFTTAFSNLSTSQFIDQILIAQLNVATLVIGKDARVARGGEGTAEKVAELLHARGRDCVILDLLDELGEKISSRRIRSEIANGNVEHAQNLLGRPFALDAKVIRGDGRGRKINFPTANLYSPFQVMPANGVYACTLSIAGRRYKAVTNVGTRPTFNGTGVRAEAHVIDAPVEIDKFLYYGARCQVEFIARLRSEVRFESVEALVTQIGADVDQARKILK